MAIVDSGPGVGHPTIATQMFARQQIGQPPDILFVEPGGSLTADHYNQIVFLLLDFQAQLQQINTQMQALGFLNQLGAFPTQRGSGVQQ